jgi:hypothetical protein
MKKKVPPPTESFDYELAKQKVKEQFHTGKSLYGKDGAFAPLLQDMLNSILEGEIEGHQSWAMSASQLKIIFGDRMKTDL